LRFPCFALVRVVDAIEFIALICVVKCLLENILRLGRDCQKLGAGMKIFDNWHGIEIARDFGFRAFKLSNCHTTILLQ